MNGRRRTVLFIHPGALGDVILSVPAIRSVRRALPSHDVVLLSGVEVGRLLHACGEVDLALSTEGDHLMKLLTGPDDLDRDLLAWLSRCDLAVGWLADHDGRLAAALRKAGVKSVILRSPMESGLEERHQADRFLETVAAVVPTPSKGWTLNLPAQILAQGRERVKPALSTRAGPLVVIHPGSGSRHKCCDPGLLAQTMASLQRDGVVLVLAEGPADADRVAAVQRGLVQPVPVIRGLDVLAMAGVLAQAALFLGHDSGLTHVAAALGVRTVVLFGPTDSERWRPLGTHVSVLQGAPCRCASRDRVAQCAEQPCLLVPVERLLATCLALLGRPAERVETQESAGVDSCHVL